MMSKFLVSLLLLFLFSCSSVHRVMIKYEDTNPVKIQQATKGLNLQEFLPELDGTISVKSIEVDLDNKLDTGVLYMIEDNLITSLLEYNYNVVDRDPDILNSITREGNDQGISSSDYLLTYRVVECGILYSELTKEEKVKYKLSTYSSTDKVERSARTRLHCRLVDTRTSQILEAGFVDNEVNDIVRREDIKDLTSFTYSFYPHGLPLQETNKEDFSQQVEVKEDKKKNRWWIAIPLFLLFSND